MAVPGWKADAQIAERRQRLGHHALTARFFNRRSGPVGNRRAETLSTGGNGGREACRPAANDKNVGSIL
jgi:hypothetical protein